MEQHFTHLGEEDLKLYKAMRRWHNEVGDMLAYVNDVLSPHGFDEICERRFRRPAPDVTAAALMILFPWARVKDFVPPAKRQHRLLEREEFDRLCDEVGGVKRQRSTARLSAPAFRPFSFVMLGQAICNPFCAI
jgi:hypothetical protein